MARSGDRRPSYQFLLYNNSVPKTQIIMTEQTNLTDTKGADGVTAI